MKSIPVFVLAAVAVVFVGCSLNVTPVNAASNNAVAGMNEVDDRSSRIRRFSTVYYDTILSQLFFFIIVGFR